MSSFAGRACFHGRRVSNALVASAMNFRSFGFRGEETTRLSHRPPPRHQLAQNHKWVPLFSNVFHSPFFNNSMPIANIVDGRRQCRYNVEVSVCYESSWHDNSIQGSTQFDDADDDDHCTYLGVQRTTIELAIRYAAQEWPGQAITMFLYDVPAAESSHWDYSGLRYDPVACVISGVEMPKISSETNSGGQEETL